MPPARAVSIICRAVVQVGRDGLLHLHVLARSAAQISMRLQAEIGEGADIHVIHVRMAADLFVGGHEFAAVLVGELAARGLR